MIIATAPLSPIGWVSAPIVFDIKKLRLIVFQQAAKDWATCLSDTRSLLNCWILAHLLLLPILSSAEEDHLVISNETFLTDAFGNACSSIEVGPDVEVAPGVRLRLQAPEQAFFDKFSVLGQLQVYDVCLQPQELADALSKPGGYPICIPPQDFSIEVSGLSVGTASLCAASLCEDGTTSGCPLNVTVASATVDLDTGSLEAIFTADDARFDLFLDFSVGFDENCDVDLKNFSADASAVLPNVEVCPARHAEILGLSTYGLLPSYELSASGCNFSGILNFLGNVLEPNFNDLVRELTADILEREVTGFWVCMPVRQCLNDGQVCTANHECCNSNCNSDSICGPEGA